MKKIFSMKKLPILMALAIVVSVFALSYAWWSGEADASGGGVSMGRLGMSATVEPEVPGYAMMPGETLNLTYTLDNTHGGDTSYKTVFAQANFKGSTVTIKTWGDGTAIPPADWYTIALDPDLAPMLVEIASDTSDIEKMVIWFVDRTTGVCYALIDPEMIATAEVNIELAQNMPIDYMGAEFNVMDTVPYTQMMEEAIVDTFGLDLDNLDPIDDAGVLLDMSTFIFGDPPVGSRDYYMNLLYAALGR